MSTEALRKNIEEAELVVAEGVTEGWPSPIAKEGFHGRASEFVRLVEPHSEADPAALLIQFLIVVGNSIGRSPYYQFEADRQHANLFAVIVGNTSKARKGTSWSRVLQIVGQSDQSWQEQCVVTGLSSGEGLIWQVRDAEESEGSNDTGAKDKRLAVVEPEFVTVLRQGERNGNILSAILKQAWDRGNLRTMTKATPAQATGVHVSIIAHLTETELRRHLNATETANGFANRFLFACACRSKLLPLGGSFSEADYAPLDRRVTKAIQSARRTSNVRMSERAADLWTHIYARLSEGRTDLLGAVTIRSEAQTIRLALIYALLDRSENIEPEHLQAPLAVWEYCEASAAHIFGQR